MCKVPRMRVNGNAGWLHKFDRSRVDITDVPHHQAPSKPSKQIGFAGMVRSFSGLWGFGHKMFIAQGYRDHHDHKHLYVALWSNLKENVYNVTLR